MSWKTQKSQVNTRSSNLEVFCLKEVFKNFAKFTEKHLSDQNNIMLQVRNLKLRKLQHRCLPVNFVNFSWNNCLVEHLRTASSGTRVLRSLFNKVVSMTFWWHVTLLYRDSSTVISLYIFAKFFEIFFAENLLLHFLHNAFFFLFVDQWG